MTTLKDVTTRLRLMSASRLKDLSSRLRLVSTQNKDIATRFSLGGTMRVKDLSSRLRLASFTNISTRFLLTSTALSQDLTTRFVLGVTPPVGSLLQTPLLPSSHYGGMGDVPFSSGTTGKPYLVNGARLPDQPYVATAPLTVMQGTIMVPAGSTFVLLFYAPSSTTQSLLANGSVVTMQFPLPGGMYVTGSVAITATVPAGGVSGFAVPRAFGGTLLSVSPPVSTPVSVFQVICTVQQDLSVYPLVVKTQFF